MTALTFLPADPIASVSFRALSWSPSLGVLVAIADNAGAPGDKAVAISPSGISWTAVSVPSDYASWRGVVWSPELSIFVAVNEDGFGNRFMYSPDGVAWTETSSGAASTSMRGVAWSPSLGLFAAVGAGGSGYRILTSPDGNTWTGRVASGSSQSNNAVLWVAELGLFVSVASSGAGNRVMTSPDGITWTYRASSANSDWRSLAWSPELSLIVAVARLGEVMTSPDGITWTNRSATIPGSYYGEWLSVAWSPTLGVFLAVAYVPAGDVDATQLMTSPDGVSWDFIPSADLPVGLTLNAVLWVPEIGSFVLAGNYLSGSPVTPFVYTPGVLIPFWHNFYGQQEI